MAIAYDARTEDKTHTGSTVMTYSHTCTGTDRFLYVHVTTLSNNHTVNSVTYGGDTMTQVATGVTAYSSTWKVHSYYLINPASDANDVVVTLAATPTWSVRSGCTSYTGVDQTSPVLDTNSAEISSGGTCNVSLTTASDGWWIISGANPDTAFSAGTNTDTLRASYSGLADIADSGNDIAATTANAQMTHTGSRGGGVIAMAIKEAGGAAPATVLPQFTGFAGL